jgi:hypothetical protein
MHIAVKLHPSEFVDRYLVYEVRARNLSVVEPNLASEAGSWITANSHAFDDLQTAFPSLEDAIAELRAIHDRLWILEDRVREHSNASELFNVAAKEVLHLNDRRHELKQKIDQICGVASTALRVYATRTTRDRESDQFH